MSVKHLLPFCETPISTMYNNYSYPMGIIQGNNNNDTEPWAYGRYINCMFNPEFGFQFGGVFGIWELHNDFIHEVFDDIRNLPHCKYVANFRKKLDEWCYIMGMFNEYFIPGTSAYNRCTYFHDTLLIGYDEEKQVFMAYSRLSDQNMHLYELAYDDLHKAVLGKGSWYLLFKYDVDRENKLDIDLIQAELSHYYYSSPSGKTSKGTKYGLRSMNSLCLYLIDQYRGKRNIDYRYTRGLSEQKSLTQYVPIFE